MADPGFWSPAVLRARLDAFIENGGKEQLAAASAVADKECLRLRKSLTPKRRELNKHMDF